jgi:D-alanine-D-alanine ligase
VNVKSIWVICGGKSSEHDISISSARNVVPALVDAAFSVSVVYIDRLGAWYHLSSECFMQSTNLNGIDISQAQRLAVLPGAVRSFYKLDQPQESLVCDVVFSLVHGGQGEDGDLQGFLNCLSVPFVGSDVLGSSICMAKHVTKALLDSAGIATVPGVVVNRGNYKDYDFDHVCKQLGCEEIFVKPSACGSSIGVTRVRQAADFECAIAEAFCYDTTVLIEKAVVAREIECSVIGNGEARVSLPGEIVMQDNFYDYAAKYINNTADVVTPADLNADQVTTIQALAEQVYRTLNCRGLARVDLFLTSDQQLFVNEVNTLPGFTDISMFAKNWSVSGLSFDVLLKHLVDLAMDHYAVKKKMNNFLLELNTPEAVSSHG